MSTIKQHIRMSTIDSLGNITVLYPESTSNDVLINRSNNTNIPIGINTIQDIANSLAYSAFNNIIDDNTISSNSIYSSYKINNRINNINFYVDNNDNKLHFIDSNNINHTIEYTSGSGNVTSNYVLEGYTYSSDEGANLSGTMVNRGAINKSINPNSTYTIPEGYHNGSGIVSCSGNYKEDTYTMTSGQYSGSKDMGINNTYRYVNATNVYNKGVSDGPVHTGTYTFASGSTGATVDLGVKHNYRYVNADNVYQKGKDDKKSKCTWYGTSSITLKDMFPRTYNYPISPGTQTLTYTFITQSSSNGGTLYPQYIRITSSGF